MVGPQGYILWPPRKIFTSHEIFWNSSLLFADLFFSQNFPFTFPPVLNSCTLGYFLKMIALLLKYFFNVMKEIRFSMLFILYWRTFSPPRSGKRRSRSGDRRRRSRSGSKRSKTRNVGGKKVIFMYFYVCVPSNVSRLVLHSNLFIGLDLYSFSNLMNVKYCKKRNLEIANLYPVIGPGVL